MSFGMFVLLFTLLKLMRMMAAATVVLAAALILCRLGGARTWRLNLGMLALVPFACLMGYSKIFHWTAVYSYELCPGAYHRGTGGDLFYGDRRSGCAAYPAAQKVTQGALQNAALGKSGIQRTASQGQKMEDPCLSDRGVLQPVCRRNTAALYCAAADTARAAFKRRICGGNLS